MLRQPRAAGWLRGSAASFFHAGTTHVPEKPERREMGRGAAEGSKQHGEVCAQPEDRPEAAGAEGSGVSQEDGIGRQERKPTLTESALTMMLAESFELYSCEKVL